MSHARSGRLVVGVTGNIACGKSSALRVLEELGAETVDADALAHQALAPDGPAHAEVVRRFGPSIRQPGGEVDRRRLGAIVFSDPAALRDLERLIHPHVLARVRARIAEGGGPLVVDAIKLLESGLAELCAQVWVVTCRPEQQVERLRARNGYSRAEALLRIEAQTPQEEKVRAADVVIDNSGTPEQTRRQLEAAWRRLAGAPWSAAAGGEGDHADRRPE